MQVKINILFVINPISGGKEKLRIPALIDKYLDKEKYSPNFSFTEYIGHAAEIAEEAINKNFDIIVAAGGDGTVNEVAKMVMRYKKILGVLPMGSGNGLARFLGIPGSLKEAVLTLNKLKTDKIDTAIFNDKQFFNLAGIGFDAHLSSAFSNDKKRGLISYIKLGLQELLSYKSMEYLINIDGTEYTRKAFALTIANSSQYGNNVYISPEASVKDGLLDVCIIKPFSILKLPVLSYIMFTGKAENSDMIEIIRGKNIRIFRQNAGAVHIDGEPLFMGKEIEINVSPLSLEVIVP